MLQKLKHEYARAGNFYLIQFNPDKQKIMDTGITGTAHWLDFLVNDPTHLRVGYGNHGTSSQITHRRYNSP